MEQNIDQIKAIISSDSDMAEKINAMPYNLHLEDLIEFLGFCESTTRKITQQPGFPYVRTGISKLTVPRPYYADKQIGNLYLEKCISAYKRCQIASTVKTKGLLNNEQTTRYETGIFRSLLPKEKEVQKRHRLCPATQ